MATTDDLFSNLLPEPASVGAKEGGGGGGGNRGGTSTKDGGPGGDVSLADYAERVEDQHFMLQKEVVERMVAQPGGKEYGRLSVMLQWRYHMELLFIVPPTAFDPPPRVDSAIVRMIPKKEKLACKLQNLEQVVTKSFSQRRKTIRNCVAGLFTEQQLMEVGIDPQLRAETIPLEQYVALANLLPA